ncbi:acyl-CoA dehydrogenase [Acuticoccus sediminis]|uniref:Medium-chain specific acyl-CoA dehydrogenase, mitochondrial n=1 Tax=Acuticoccus sediminis TaxID=2184697 RepID=A0A8B2NRT4_9HYPH|nr:acyl-CoA dehydrogenase [Acuticoccus sediminis]RAH98936.1 acyl-CoA dehydrogenase [Acuticoccus sediminis]
MDFELSDDLKMMKDQVRRFVDTEVIPIEREASDGFDMLPEYRARLEAKTRALGYWYVELPEDLGGLGLGLTARVILWEEMGRTIACPPRKQSIFGPEVSPMLINLTEAQKEKYLYPVISGEKASCFALSEPDAGGDPGAIRSTAVKDGDGYVINGYKRYITNAQKADFAQVMAVTDPVKGRRGGISAFLVDMDTPGVTIAREQQTMMGDRPCELAFEDVRVPADALMGEEGQGFALSQDWINQGRIRHGARAIGVIERMLELSAEYAKDRKTFGKPLAERQAVQWMLVDSYVDLQALRLMVYTTAAAYDRGEDVRNDAYVVKMRGDKMAFEATDRAMQIFGGAGVTLDLPIEKFWRDQRSMMITEGPEEILRGALAQKILRDYA